MAKENTQEAFYELDETTEELPVEETGDVGGVDTSFIDKFNKDDIAERFNIPAHILNNTIKKACSMMKSALTNYYNGTIKHFRVRYIKKTKSNVHIIESFGTQGYFSCLKFCSFVLGNSSSGIIEAASFGKYVINLGDRQKGRDSGPNIIQCPVVKNEILNAIHKINQLPKQNKTNIYGKGNTADKIIKILKSKTLNFA